MKILHVSLGTLKFRSGGLTIYANDLIIEQKKIGLEPVMIYPGRFKVFEKTKIIQKKNENFELYEIVNPTFVAIPFGVKNPIKVMKNVEIKIYKEFLSKLKPKIIHVHTFMGIHQSFFDAAKELKIPLLYTTHDYYALCPKTNMIDFEGKLCEEINGERCIKCNYKLNTSDYLQYIMQSGVYQELKNTKVLKILRRVKRKKIEEKKEKKEKKELSVEKILKNINEFERFNNYRKDILEKFDLIHCNSQIAKEVYDKYINNEKIVVPITLSDIKDNRNLREKKENEKIKIGYIGSKDLYKGLNFLLESIRILSKKNNNYELYLYGDDFSDLSFENELNCYKKGRYLRENLKDIMDELDLLIVPSIWKETFGFITLESLSYGVPVMVSKFVGSKEIIKKIDSSCIFNLDNIELYKKLEFFIENKEYRKKLIEKFKNTKINFEIENHVKEIVKVYEYMSNS